MKKKSSKDQIQELEETVESLNAACEGHVETIKEKDALIEEYLNAAKMVQADFENYKKRSIRDTQRQVSFAKEGILLSILEIKDNFERALALADNQEVPKDFLKGVEMIHAQLCKLLSDEQVTPINCVGKEFDPYFHEALFMDDSGAGCIDVVCEEFQKGYIYNDKVIRHSKVKVKKQDSSQEGE